MIAIPPKFRDILNTPGYEGILAYTVKVLEIIDIWLSDNQVVFFPEYTNHSSRHVQEVLSSAEELIADSSWEAITVEDVSALIISICIHDAGMHITKGGFFSLIEGLYDHKGSTYLTYDEPWRDIWMKFISEAKRFDDKMLGNIFGDNNPITIPNKDRSTWHDRENLLIGEFLRRHHPRLAHDLILFGIPNSDGGIAHSFDFVPMDVRDRCGLIARSHGMDLRQAVDLIRRPLRAKESNVHVPFIMALVRVGDYLQLQNSRAPSVLQNIKNIKSPLSRREWAVHKATIDITIGEDPELLYVQANADSIEVLDRIRVLLRDVQSELDKTWAVLGEVYGRRTEQSMHKLGLSIRRIDSNVYDDDFLRNTLPFYPIAAKLSTANTDLLELLAKPLYGDDAAVGVRELLQNALDAVAEYKSYSSNKSEVYTDTYSRKGMIDIKIYENNGQRWFEICDDGIGMTVDTVVNYFLRAGASFRRSSFWEENFSEEHGGSQVYRTGRFGVGALAGFLIGPTITVTTRHMLSRPDEAITFSYSMSDSYIELKKTKAPVGTKISIMIVDDKKWARISKSTPRNHLNWYYLSNPPVDIKIGTEKLRPIAYFPNVDETLPRGYRKITPRGYKEVHWTIDKYYDPLLIINGVRISGATTSLRYRADRYLGAEYDMADYGPRAPGDRDRWSELKLKRPSISIFDPNNIAPIDLSRTRLVEKLQFQDDLIENMCTDVIAYILAEAPEEFDLEKISKTFTAMWHPALAYASMYRPIEDHWLVWSHEGVAINDLTLLNFLSVSEVLYAPRRFEDISTQIFPLKKADRVICLCRTDPSKGRFADGLRIAVGHDARSIKGATALINANTASYLMNGKLPKKLISSLDSINTSNGITILRKNTIEDEPLDLAGYHLPENVLIALSILNSDFVKDIESHIVNTWQKLIGRQFIPYDVKERYEIAQANPVLLSLYEEHKQKRLDRLQNEPSGNEFIVPEEEEEEEEEEED